jgi:hypothetical protein
MSCFYPLARLMPIYSVIVPIKFRLSPGDGFEALHSCPVWF